MSADKAYHGGAFFEAIGEDFSSMERAHNVVSADVLDAWFDPSPNVINKVREHLPFSIRTSPPTHAGGLIATIAQARGIPEENIVVAGGSSDLMFVFFPQMLKKDSKVLILNPTYGEYPHILENVVDATIIHHALDPENGFTVDPASLEKDIRSFLPEMVIIVNPNNPTGRYWNRDEILSLVQTYDDVLFVIDEAYIDYVGREQSLEKETAAHKNLVIMKSMSKAYALSGARVAYIAAHPTIAQKIRRFIPPWSVSLIGQIAAVEALKDEAYYKKKYEETHIMRDAMIDALQRTGAVVALPGVANFFLIRLTGPSDGAESIVQKLRASNIYLRNCDSMSSRFQGNFIRVAVKDGASNALIVDALKKELCGDGKPAVRRDAPASAAIQKRRRPC